MNALRHIRRFLSACVAIAMVIVVPASLMGCTALAPDRVDACLTHVSHPLKGPPFGPTTEEDSLDTVGACSRWERGRWALDTGLHYKYKDGGFYGDDFVYQGRISYRLWSKQ